MVAGNASAGTISAVGSVTALTDRSQITADIIATEDFNALPNGQIDLNLLSSEGIQFNNGAFATILPGVSEAGSATTPSVTNFDTSSRFPNPIAGGGSASGNYLQFGGVMTFTETVTQFGLTFSRNGNQFITAWDTSGDLIGQVSWQPTNDAAFVGIDTLGVAIGMLAVGNDDVFGGQFYSVGGSTIMTDDYVWAGQISNVPVPAALPLLATAFAGFGLISWRKRRKAAA